MKTLPYLALLFLCSCAHETTVALRGVSLYITASENQVIVVECHKGGLDEWRRVSNVIGNGTNAAPEFIVTVPTNKTVFYRFRPE